MIFLLGGLWLGLMLRLWQLSLPHHCAWLAELRNRTGTWCLARWFSGLAHWLEPGWVVQSCSFKTLAKRLPMGNLRLSTDAFYRLKQGLFWLGGSGFLAWLWWGSFSAKDGVILALLWGAFLSLPELYLWQEYTRVKRRIETEVPYFLDLLTLTLQSGSNLQQALVSTTKCYQSLLSKMVAKRLQELPWGRSMEGVLMDLTADVENEDFNHFLSSVRRVKNLGVSLSETLAIQIEILRTKRRQRAEELSRTASVKISLPLVLFIFPALLIIYIGPGILQLLMRT